jgi:hypothetical protein
MTDDESNSASMEDAANFATRHLPQPSTLRCLKRDTSTAH